MKKFLFAAATGLFLFAISCKDTTTSSTNSTEEKNSARNKEVYRAIETGDVSKLDSFIDKNIVDHSEMGDIHGLDSLKKMFVEMHNKFSGLKMEPIAQATSADGEYHFAWFKMTGTCTDSSMGMPAGTKMDMNGVDVVKIKNDKAVEHWGFADPKDMMKMMGGNHKMNMKMDNKMDNKMKMNDSSKM